MILAVIILSVLLVLSIIVSVFCYMHYHLQKKDFEAYQRISENQILYERYIDKIVDAMYDISFDLTKEIRTK
jgi:uncharacterized membrane protein